jgi:hypothetical protein
MNRALTIGALCLSVGLLSACSSTDNDDTFAAETTYEDIAVPTPEAAQADADEMITDENFEEEFERLKEEIENDDG